MKALIRDKYGSSDVLQFRDVERPTPKDDEVLVRVRAASINATDFHLLGAKLILIRLEAGGLVNPKIKILGADVAGHIEAVGKSVSAFKPGDAVMGDVSESGYGGFAEYVCVRASSLTLKPADMSFEVAAAIPLAGITALQGLRDVGQIKAGQKVLIQGASGGVGTFAIQIAKILGAVVTAVCSTRNLDLVRSLGADHVIDYKREDFTTSGNRYDVIFAVNGHHSLPDYKRALTPDGIYVEAGGTYRQVLEAVFLGSWYSRLGTNKFLSLSAKPSVKDLQILLEWIQAGKVTPYIDKCFSFNEAIEAFRYVEKQHASGKVVISFAE